MIEDKARSSPTPTRPPRISISNYAQNVCIGTNAHMTILVARPGYGKTLLLTNVFLPLELANRRGGSVKKQGGFLSVEQSEKRVRLDIYDPKMDIVHRIPNGYDVFAHQSAADAAEAGYQAGDGVIVLEEGLTIPRSEYNRLRAISAIRRRSFRGNGPGIYVTTQRPVNMPVEFRAFSDQWLIGRIDDPDDLSMIAAKAGRGYAKTIKKLKVGEFILLRF